MLRLESICIIAVFTVMQHQSAAATDLIKQRIMHDYFQQNRGQLAELLGLGGCDSSAVMVTLPPMIESEENSRSTNHLIDSSRSNDLIGSLESENAISHAELQPEERRGPSDLPGPWSRDLLGLMESSVVCFDEVAATKEGPGDAASPVVTGRTEGYCSHSEEHDPEHEQQLATVSSLMPYGPLSEPGTGRTEGYCTNEDSSRLGEMITLSLYTGSSAAMPELVENLKDTSEHGSSISPEMWLRQKREYGRSTDLMIFGSQSSLVEPVSGQNQFPTAIHDGQSTSHQLDAESPCGMNSGSSHSLPQSQQGLEPSDQHSPIQGRSQGHGQDVNSYSTCSSGSVSANHHHHFMCTLQPYYSSESVSSVSLATAAAVHGNDRDATIENDLILNSVPPPETVTQKLEADTSSQSLASFLFNETVCQNPSENDASQATQTSLKPPSASGIADHSKSNSGAANCITAESDKVRQQLQQWKKERLSRVNCQVSQTSSLSNNTKGSSDRKSDEVKAKSRTVRLYNQLEEVQRTKSAKEKEKQRLENLTKKNNYAEQLRLRQKHKKAQSREL